MGRVVELRRITKRYGDLLANDEIDLQLRPGRIHALLGANGAGKTTLMNVLIGLVEPDSGEVVREPGTVIGMVHQHFKLVNAFTVAENIVLGREPGTGPFVDMAAARALVQRRSAQLGLELDPDAVVADLPVGARQRVEIVKALATDADLLVLDEPTAVLMPPEVDQLFAVLRTLRDAGRGVVLITHKLAEAKRVADVITVLRDGRVVAEVGPETPAARLAELMIGQAVPARRPRVAGGSGEVLGVAGAPDSGQDELVFGLLADADGPVAYIPADRATDGFIAEFTIAENLVLDQLGQFTRHGFLQRNRIRATAQQRVEQFGLNVGIDRTAGTLSGGNQQRLVLARALSRPTRLVVACEPTRGLDVAAVGFVHDRLLAARDAGARVVLVSSDLDELTVLADRLVVLHRGRVVAEVPPDTPRTRLGLLMAGIVDDRA